MRSVLLMLGSIVAFNAGAIQVQRAADPGADTGARRAEAPDEVIVRGKRLGELRLQVTAARERAYAIFNEINSNDGFDVRCREVRRYFSHATRRVCRAQFEDRISAAAGAEYLGMLFMSCPGEGITQDCMFSGYGQTAANAARRVEGQLPNKRDEMNDEIVRLANENDEFAQAILDFYEASRQYDEARGRRDE